MDNLQHLGYMILFLAWTILAVVRESMYTREGKSGFAMLWGIVATLCPIFMLFILFRWMGLL